MGVGISTTIDISTGCAPVVVEVQSVTVGLAEQQVQSCLGHPPLTLQHMPCNDVIRLPYQTENGQNSLIM